MKKIFVIDWCMLLSFIATLITGLGMHIAGHSAEHWLWEVWATLHSLMGLSCIIAGIMHIKTHLAWYKGWLKSGLGNKSRVTVILSAIYSIALISGIALLFIEGANTHMGLLHYKIGIGLAIIGLGHFAKRLPILRKSLKR